MLSADLAELYGVPPKVLVQAVKRNRKRFPADFMFQLTRDEWAALKSQSVTSSWGGARRAAPYAFTEQGVAMLSSVLRSPRAVAVNIEWIWQRIMTPLWWDWAMNTAIDRDELIDAACDAKLISRADSWWRKREANSRAKQRTGLGT